MPRDALLCLALIACGGCGGHGSSPQPSDAMADAAIERTVCADVVSPHAVATTATAVTIAWPGGGDGVTYKVSRKTLCGTDDYIDLASLQADVEVYTDTAVTANFVYWYLITATDPAGNTASAAVSAQASPGNGSGCAGNEPPQPNDARAVCDAHDAGT